MSTAPHGTWRSPITAESIARGGVDFGEPLFAGGWLYWIESRPLESGRNVIVRARADGAERADVIPVGFAARTRVHEYGGGSYTVTGDTVVFSNDSDGRVYALRPGEEPFAVTPAPPHPRALRYADFAAHGERVFCVRESHIGAGESVNSLVTFEVAPGADVTVVAEGHDFYSTPRPSPDGRQLAWLSWDHPLMPWDGSVLNLATIDGSDPQHRAGGRSESITQATWSADGLLHWMSDRTGWWNLYREDAPLYPAAAEFAMPQWVFGLQSYAFMDDGQIACVWSEEAFPHVGMLDPGSGALDELELELLPELRSIRVTGDGERLAYIGGSATHTVAVVVVEHGTARVVASEAQPDPAYLSEPRAIEFPSAGGRRSHALFYPPHNADFEPPPDEKPPLIVIGHGGPTSQAEPLLDLKKQFWTSRGFAVVDVNYGGSTGYGRDYRQLLRGNWGVIDVEDCVAAARHLADAGTVDPARLAIRGSSAGGYTTLCALVFSDVFDVGASYYGIADLRVIARETHKFESRYLVDLVPPDQVEERSPIHSVERISAPVIVLQGSDDAVVPPSQAELIVAALAANGIEHEYRLYEGEGHGFRGAEAIIDSLEAELAFYARVLGFSAAASG